MLQIAESSAVNLVKRKVLAISVIAVLLVAAGCASSTPDPVAIQPLESTKRIADEYRNVILSSESAPGVEIPQDEKSRVIALVRQELERRAPGQFNIVDQPEPGFVAVPAYYEASSFPSKTLHMHIRFIEYDEGDALARFILAGLGQIRIGTEVTLRDKLTGEILGKYEVSKRFALGGVAGASTTVKDVEEGLAKGIVEVLVPR